MHDQFFPEPARRWQSGPDFLWWSASIPVQAPSITRTHMHARTQACSVCNQDRFYVQGPSIIHGIFNANRLQQFVSIIGVEFEMSSTVQFPASLCLPLPCLISYNKSFCDIYCMPSQQITTLSDLSNNQLILQTLCAAWTLSGSIKSTAAGSSSQACPGLSFTLLTNDVLKDSDHFRGWQRLSSLLQQHCTFIQKKISSSSFGLTVPDLTPRCHGDLTVLSALSQLDDDLQTSDSHSLAVNMKNAAPNGRKPVIIRRDEKRELTGRKML